MSRIEEEIALLNGVVSEVEVSPDGCWARVPDYRLPAGWKPQSTDIAIHFRPGFEQCGFYGIYTRPGLLFGGATPSNYAVASDVPFAGDWWIFSWEIDGWQAHADIHKGTNVVNWYNGIGERLRQGA